MPSTAGTVASLITLLIYRATPASIHQGVTGYDGWVTRPDTATKHTADVSAMFDEVSPK